jgi:hypothetical protein
MHADAHPHVHKIDAGGDDIDQDLAGARRTDRSFLQFQLLRTTCGVYDNGFHEGFISINWTMLSNIY